MSKYTTQIRWLVEDSEMKATDTRPDGAMYHQSTYKKLGLDQFPIFNEDYRYTLCDKIINHYMFREIGLETVALFAWYMRQTMWEIMPYYNKMYEAVELVTDPLVDFKRDFTENWAVNHDDTEIQGYDNTRTINEDTDTHSVGNTKNKDRNVYQDTPMSLLDNPSPNPVENLQYATNVTYDDGNVDSTNDTTTNRDTTNHHGGSDTLTKDKNEKGGREKHETGINRAQVELLDIYRKKMINVDVLIIEELQDLFMPLW